MSENFQTITSKESGQLRLSRRQFLEQAAKYLVGLTIAPQIPTEEPHPIDVRMEDMPDTEPGTRTTPFRVFLPGLTGGGKGITAIRDQLHNLYGDNILIPSSISHPSSLKTQEGVNSHFQNLAQEIAIKAADRNVQIIAHSMGGLESIDLVNFLIDSDLWKGKEVKINYISTPGFIERGLDGFINLASALVQLRGNASLAEQHVAYPLPESYYQVYPPTNPPSDKAKTIFKDSPDKRTARRAWFGEQMIKLLPEENERKEFKDKLASLDMEIEQSLSRHDDEKLGDVLRKRAQHLSSIIQALFHGQHIDDEIHQKYMVLYRETVDQLAPGLQYYVILLQYVSRVSGYINSGMGNILRSAIDNARKKGKSIKISFTLLEKDFVVNCGNIDVIRKQIADNGLEDCLRGLFFMEQLAHSSFGYRPEGLEKVYEVM